LRIDWEGAPFRGAFSDIGEYSPLSPLFFSVPGTALDEGYVELNARAAARKIAWWEKAELSSTCTRRVLRKITAPT
jgi:hypothetical protein